MHQAVIHGSAEQVQQQLWLQLDGPLWPQQAEPPSQWRQLAALLLQSPLQALSRGSLATKLDPKAMADAPADATTPLAPL